MRFVSRRAALLRGGSSKENWTKERVCERREAHRREPRRVSRRSSHAAKRLRTSRNLFVVYEICASLDKYWAAQFLSFSFARSPKSLGAKDHRQDLIFIPRKKCAIVNFDTILLSRFLVAIEFEDTDVGSRNIMPIFTEMERYI